MKQVEIDICYNKHAGNELSNEANPSAESKSLMQAHILDYIRRCGPAGATSEQISIELGLPINRVSGRCSELKRDKKVVVQGTRLNRSGSRAGVLVAI